MKINIFGLGYVGSVSAACLASEGHEVLGIDPDHFKVECVNDGRPPVLEPELPELIRAVVESKKLRATCGPAEDAEISMVCVGTPSNENGSLCLDHVMRASEQIGAFIGTRSAYHVVCIRSTVLPGTIESLVIPILEKVSGKSAGPDFGVCMNPEFLREGSSIRDFRCPPLTIIGQLDCRSGDTLASLYSNVTAPLVRSTLAVAEMVKYAGNAFHALKITFANEIGTLCKHLDINGPEVFKIFCQDKKLNISSAYLQPGFAFGGSCLPKDLRALLYRAKEMDLNLPVVGSILESNAEHVEAAYRLVRKTGKKRIAVVGLSFKPGTDDLRESPMVTLIELLIGKGYDVAIYDGDVALARLVGANRAYIERTIPHISRLIAESLDSAISNSDVVVIAKRSPVLEEQLPQVAESKMIIDLVGLGPRPHGQSAQNYEGICW